MIETSESILNLAAAMLQVETSVGGVVRDSTNPHFRNRYASLEGVIEAIRPHYTEAGLAVVQSPGSVANGCLSLVTLIMHVSGEWLKSSMQIPLGKIDPQGAGSAITYACRYSLMALFNLPPVDDDAEGAQPDKPAAQPAPTSKLPFNMPQGALSADLVLGIPTSPIQWGEMLGKLQEFSKEQEWPVLKAFWKANTPFFEAMKAASELDFDRTQKMFTSKKTAK